MGVEENVQPCVLAARRSSPSQRMPPRGIIETGLNVTGTPRETTERGHSHEKTGRSEDRPVVVVESGGLALAVLAAIPSFVQSVHETAAGAAGL